MNNKSARIDIRTSKSAKETIENAAKQLGTNVSSFILESAMEKANTILLKAQTLELTNQEFHRFIEALDGPAEPNKNLKDLFSKHHKANRQQS